jgi:hypothetical protein
MNRLLSPHEIAMLFVLLTSPIAVELADPDVASLQQERLVELVTTAVDAAEFKLKSEGAELIRRFESMRGDA